MISTNKTRSSTDCSFTPSRDNYNYQWISLMSRKLLFCSLFEYLSTSHLFHFLTVEFLKKWMASKPIIKGCFMTLLSATKHRQLEMATCSLAIHRCKLKWAKRKLQIKKINLQSTENWLFLLVILKTVNMHPKLGDSILLNYFNTNCMDSD